MLLKAFPDEILFSRLCRSLSVSGLSVDKYTISLQLEARSSFHPFLTQHLTEIARVNNENPMFLWYEQTLFPLWVWAMPDYAKELCQLNGPNSFLKSFYQLTGNHSSQRMRLNFCPLCARDDAMNYGVPYWHCQHQIPGVSACYRHRCQLLHRLVPPSPYISIELYPDLFNEGGLCNTIEVDFARYASIVLTKLARRKISNNNILLKKHQTTKVNHATRSKLDDSLYDIIECLFDDENRPNVLEKTRFINYIIKKNKSILPSRKLFLGFYFERLCRGPDKASLSIKSQSQGQNQDEPFYEDTKKFNSEIRSLMKKTWFV